MVLINGRKFACEACIRGHRASGCAHTGRQMLLVRPKGRPSTQCDQCKAKRELGSFHGRCTCHGQGFDDGDEDQHGGDSVEESSGRPSPTQRQKRKRIASIGKDGTPLEVFHAAGSHGDGAVYRVDAPGTGTSASKHSLASLMNPCQCRSTGICTCCKSSIATTLESSAETASMQDTAAHTDCPCDGGDNCCDDNVEASACAKARNTKGGAKSCCGSASRSLPSAGRERVGLGLEECQCGAGCSCPGCEYKSRESNVDVEVDECPERCQSCTSCAFGLTRPSGIEAVDAWMDRDKDRLEKDEDRRGTDGKIGAGKRITIAQPPLPPFDSAKHYYATHFLDKARREWFAARKQDALHDLPEEQSRDTGQNVVAAPAETSFGARQLDETTEDWQARHGFVHLTPDMIAIFDRSQAFRAQRAQEEQAVEAAAAVEEAKTTADESLHGGGPADAQDNRSSLEGDLSALRARALSARRTPSKPHQMPARPVSAVATQ